MFHQMNPTEAGALMCASQRVEKCVSENLIKLKKILTQF